MLLRYKSAICDSDQSELRIQPRCDPRARDHNSVDCTHVLCDVTRGLKHCGFLAAMFRSGLDSHSISMLFLDACFHATQHKRNFKKNNKKKHPHLFLSSRRKKNPPYSNANSDIISNFIPIKY